MAGARRPEDAAGVIEDVIERVFASVAQVRDLLLQRHDAVQARGERLSDADIRGLAPAITALLRRPGQVAAGLGLILEPGLLPTHPLRLEWWQCTPGHDQPVALEVDLHPHSLDFYD